MTRPDPNSKLDRSITVLAENVRIGLEEVSRTLAERVAALLSPVFERIDIQDSYIQELTEQNEALTKRVEALEHERATEQQHTTE